MDESRDRKTILTYNPRGKINIGRQMKIWIYQPTLYTRRTITACVEPIKTKLSPHTVLITISNRHHLLCISTVTHIISLHVGLRQIARCGDRMSMCSNQSIMASFPRDIEWTPLVCLVIKSSQRVLPACENHPNIISFFILKNKIETNHAEQYITRYSVLLHQN